MRHQRSLPPAARLSCSVTSEVSGDAGALAGSAYVEAEHGVVAGVPSIDLDLERACAKAVSGGRSATGCWSRRTTARTVGSWWPWPRAVSPETLGSSCTTEVIRALGCGALRRGAVSHSSHRSAADALPCVRAAGRGGRRAVDQAGCDGRATRWRFRASWMYRLPRWRTRGGTGWHGPWGGLRQC